MKIVIVATSYPAAQGDPAGLFVQYEAEQLHDQGHRVVVICPGDRRATTRSGPTIVRIADWGAFGHPGATIRLRDNPWRAFGHLAFIVGARHQLRKLGPFDAVYSHWLLPSGWPICSRRSEQFTRWEVVLHGGDVRALCNLPRWLRCYIVHSVLKGGATLRFVAEGLRDKLTAATTPQVGAQSYVQACQTNTSGAPCRQRARAQLSIRRNQRVAVLVARLVPSKRIALALQSLRGIVELRVIVVGDGPDGRKLREQFPEVEFVGRQPHAKALQYIAAADLLVSASLLEGAPLAIREARELGTAVVALPAGDLLQLANNDPHLWVLQEQNQTGTVTARQ